MISAKQLAALMKRWRTQEGLSTAAAGKALDLSSRTIEGIEQGRGFACARVLEIALRSMLQVKDGKP